MAILRRLSDGTRTAVSGHCLVGRSWVCGLKLDRRRVSAEHATIRWQNGRWLIRDLASSNGTTLDERPVPSGKEVPLMRGQTIVFGDPDENWKVEDDRPPCALALCHGSSETSVINDGLLCVPNEQEPTAVIRSADDLTWILEIEGEVRAITNGQTFHVGGREWRFHLPVESAAETARADVALAPRAELFANIAICVRVSRDQDDVNITAKLADGEINLGVRSCFQIVYLLARARFENPQDGWVETSKILKQLGRRVDTSHLNVDIFRVRRAFRDAGVPDPNSVIERRTGHLRLGTHRGEISEL